MMKRWAFTLTLVAVLTLGLAGGAAAFDSPEFWYFYDGADDIDEFWTRTAVNRSDIFIIDSSEVFEGEGTPQGTFRLFADPSRHVEGDGVRFANAYFDVAPVLSWDLEFRAQFRSLAARAADAPLNMAPYRGFVVGVRADWGRIHLVSFYEGAIAVIGSPEIVYSIDPAIVGAAEDDFHTWRISYDALTQTITISKDSETVLSIPGVKAGGHGEKQGLRMAISHVDTVGTSDILLDYIAFNQ